MVQSVGTGATDDSPPSGPFLPCIDMLRSLLPVACVSVAFAGGVGARAAEKADWTVLAYLSGDGSLEGAALGYLRKLAAVPGSDRVCLVAQIDRAPGYSREFGDFTDARRIAFVTRQAGERREWSRMADPGEVNMGDPETLAGFALWAIEAFPAERYALLLMGHGNGVRELTAKPDEMAPPSGIGYDATSDGDVLTVREIGEACRRIGMVCGSGRISLLALDACFSATAELGCEVAPAVEYLTGSPGLIYEPGVPWDGVLGYVASHPATEPYELARLAVALTERQHAGGAYLAADLEPAQELAAALRALSDELRSRMSEVAPLVTLARSRAPTSGLHLEMLELSALLEALSESAREQGLDSLARKAEQAREIADSMVLNAYADDAGGAQPTCRGWAVFFPPNLTAFPADYLTSSSFARDAGWASLLGSYLKHLRDLVTRQAGGGSRLGS